MRHDALIDSLTTVLHKLEAKDAQGTAPLMSALVEQFKRTPSPTADPRVMPLYQHCVALANQLTSDLGHEIQSHARGARAKNAYGDSP